MSDGLFAVVAVAWLLPAVLAILAELYRTLVRALTPNVSDVETTGLPSWIKTDDEVS